MAQFPLLACLEPNSWDFLAEGLDSIIFMFCGPEDSQYHGKVLRLFKNRNPGFEKSGDDPVTDFHDRTVMMLKFWSRCITPYVPSFDHGAPVSVTPEFISELADLAESKRSASRIEMTHVCRTSTAGLVHENHITPGSLVVEIKPKWGFCPDCPLLPKNRVSRNIPRFAMMQHVKLSRGETSSISAYDPRDLFSRDLPRVKKAVDSLCAHPQGNLSVSRNCSKSTLTEEEKGRLVDVLVRMEALDHVLALQKLDLWDVECIEPIVAKADSVTWEELLEDQFVLDGIRDMIASNKRLTEDDVQRLSSMDKETARMYITGFLISQAAKDCSIMIAFRDGSDDVETHVIDMGLKNPEIVLSQYLAQSKKVIAAYESAAGLS